MGHAPLCYDNRYISPHIELTVGVRSRDLHTRILQALLQWLPKHRVLLEPYPSVSASRVTRKREGDAPDLSGSYLLGWDFDFCALVKFCHQALSEALVGGCSAVMDLDVDDGGIGRFETSAVGGRWSECGADPGTGVVLDFVGVRLGE